jgi:putative restriction endonuclease
MPAVARQDIVGALRDAFLEAGCQAQLISPVREHPRRFQVIQPDEVPFTVWVYIWTVTHGGATRAVDEFRIQMTSVSPPLTMNPNGPTVLLGWDPNLQVFAGFDLARHRTFTTGSPSVQIPLSALQSAVNFGFGFSRKDNGEVAVAFRPSQIVNYIANAPAFHAQGTNAMTMNLLRRVASLQPVPEQEVEGLSAPRRRIVETVSKLARDSNFRDQVLDAYGQRCAVTRAQLKLVDAAHILPVGADGSTDLVTNGIALSPTYHRAFDHGLIYLDPKFRMVIHPARVDYLHRLDLKAGLAEFRIYLGNVVHLPANPMQRPSVGMIRRANTFRNIRVA